jgi:hypothetical protein
MQLEEYMAEVRGIHLELAHLSERWAQCVGDGNVEVVDAGHASTLLQRQRQLHMRLAQLDALMLHGR